jgi:hypothetical protein
LTTDVETRLAALKSSTPGNEFQRLIFSGPDSEANASGMVSNQNERLSIPESRQKLRSSERTKLDDDRSSERPFLKSEQTQRLWSRGILETDVGCAAV